ncbi:transcriptional regulator TACO1-like protein [Limtongia smithiae]|uniref:transcriptional regulator TACO1-like protein n=1 Tax=Limtongia smithiae TaxID=1125753 RepID=UPI0034D00340
MKSLSLPLCSIRIQHRCTPPYFAPSSSTTRLHAFIVPHHVRTFTGTTTLRSGHNKWSTIKHTKAANDSIKNALAMKFSRQIVAAAKLGGPDPNNNATLFNAIESAKRNQVTKKTIENALRRAAGQSSTDGKTLESVTYEAAGPSGSALVVEALTDNKNRTFAAVRSVLTKYGCAVGPCLYLFDRKGVIRITKRATDETPAAIDFDEIFEHAIDAGAEDIEVVEDFNDDDDVVVSAAGTTAVAKLPLYQITTEAADTAKVAQKMREEYGYDIKDMGVEYLPKPDIIVELDPEMSEIMGKLMAALDEIDDVQEVYTSAK